jgi:hypothetical protein
MMGSLLGRRRRCAERAAQLGGEVVAPPYDISVASLRQAVLADP